jgi:hypothetical protein
MLHSGELQGERVEGHVKVVPGPCKVRADSVYALLRAGQEDTQRQERRDTGEAAAETAALSEDFTGQARKNGPRERERADALRPSSTRSAVTGGVGSSEALLKGCSEVSSARG